MKRLSYGRKVDGSAEAATVLWLSDREAEAMALDPRIVWLRFDESLHRRLWKKLRDIVLKEWIKEFPGTRPAAWWAYDAPRQSRGTFPGCFYDGQLSEPRKQLSGAGVPAWTVLNLVPSFAYGLPTAWADLDESDEPQFESQASYLKRFKLFERGEANRLSAADFLPEVLGEVHVYDSRPWREVAKESILARVAAGEETAERAAVLLAGLRE